MITYELAKQLKDAGFQYDWSEMEDHDQNLLIQDWHIYGKGYSPTLSELIEACGKDFCNMKQDIGENGVEKGKWACNWWEHDSSGATYGSTPEEAVAKLWLAINEK